MQSLENEYPQLSFLPEAQLEQRQEDLEVTMQELRQRFGHFSIRRGIDQQLSNLDTRDQASAQAVAFYRGEK